MKTLSSRFPVRASMIQITQSQCCTLQRISLHRKQTLNIPQCAMESCMATIHLTKDTPPFLHTHCLHQVTHHASHPHDSDRLPICATFVTAACTLSVLHRTHCTRFHSSTVTMAWDCCACQCSCWLLKWRNVLVHNIVPKDSYCNTADGTRAT
jgi:hypothetical protein